jgi:hypothetical protein
MGICSATSATAAEHKAARASRVSRVRFTRYQLIWPLAKSAREWQLGDLSRAEARWTRHVAVALRCQSRVSHRQHDSKASTNRRCRMQMDLTALAESEGSTDAQIQDGYLLWLVSRCTSRCRTNAAASLARKIGTTAHRFLYSNPHASDTSCRDC